jgi:hypothetical protein
MTSLYCRTIFSTLMQLGCPCMVKDEFNRNRVSNIAKEYNKRIEKVANFWNDKNIKDMYISIQPLTKKLKMGKIILTLEDRSWTSEFDCFHVSL